MIYEGTYRSLIQGVSQQTPQERLDGQLGAQVNMLSDPVNGLRRRTGTKLHGRMNVPKDSKFDLVQLGGEYYIQCVTPDGRLVITRFSDMNVMLDAQFPYLVHTSKGTIRSTLSRNQCFILNTEQVPKKVVGAESVITPKTPEENRRFAWAMYTTSIQSASPVTSTDTLTVQCSGYPTVSVQEDYQHGGTTTNTYSFSTRAARILALLQADTNFTANYNVALYAGTLSIWGKTAGMPEVVVTASTTKGTAPLVSGTGGTYNRASIPTNFPSEYNGYYVDAPTRLIYDATRRVWVEPNTVVGSVNPKAAGWVRIMSGAFSKTYTITVSQGAVSGTFSVTTHASTAAQASPEYVAQSLETAMLADTTFTSNFAVFRSGTALAITASSEDNQLTVESLGGDLYISSSGGSVIRNQDLLPPTLPSSLDGYIQGVGTTDNLVYYKYSDSTKSWKESGFFEPPYTIQNCPMYWYFDYESNAVVVAALDIQGRVAGDNNNNPEPAFMGFGFTGISAYQSRLILLSGAYVCMSKSTDPSVFMRTTVREVLDDDPIEISATALSNSQFEYAVPYNKDLVLFSSTQQAVIPASSTVMTPKSAVIYPSTQAEVSMAVKPVVAARSLYYTYQRGVDYYQVGEVIPNQYTDSQYNPQNLTDHLPLYAIGVCTGMAGSSTNNMVVFTSDTNEVLVNQFVWQGDTRNIMGFHKWVLPRKVLDAAFLQEYNIFFVEDTDGNTLVLTTNTQLNQLGTKPVPFLDIYQYVQTDSTTGGNQLQYIPQGDLVGVIYDEINSRHMEVAIEVLPDGTVTSVHQGTIAVGLRYTSLFTLTPPYLKDDNSKVLAGVKSTVQSFPLTFKGTGEFKYMVQDFLGTASEVSTSAATWSEVNLGYTWINSVSTTVIPCRAKLDSLACTIQTDKTTDLNLTSAGFVLRTAKKHAVRR